MTPQTPPTPSDAPAPATPPPAYYRGPSRQSAQAPAVSVRPALLLRLLLAMIVASAAFLAGNYSLNAVLYGVDREPVRAHLRQAFERGELQLIDSRRGDRDLGVHQLNDCLIFDMAARDPAPEQFRRYLFMAQRSEEVGHPDAGMCLRLRNWLFDDPLVESQPRWRERYLYGFRAVAIVLLKNFSVDQARGLMKAASYAVFLALVLIALSALAARMARPAGRAAGLLGGGNELGYGALALAFLGFFGLAYFGQSISHAPAIVSLGLFLIAWCALDLRRALTPSRALALTVVFGLLTAHFEFLTGYIPIGSSLLVLLVALRQTDEDRVGPAELAKLFFLTQSAFIGTIVIVYLFHLVASALFTPDGMRLLNSFFVYLGVRMSTQVEAGSDTTEIVAIGPLDVLREFFEQLASLGLPSDAVGLASLLLALGVLVLGVGEALTGAQAARWRARVFMAGFAIVPVAVWLLAFQNHAVIHARFMVRVLVMLYACAGVMLFWLARMAVLPPRVPTEDQTEAQPEAPPLSEPAARRRWRPAGA